MSDKAALIDAFEALLRDRLDALERGQSDAQAGTRVDGSHRPANRGERAAVTAHGYLAQGLGERALALRESLALLAQVDRGPQVRCGPGALLRLSLDEGPEERFLVLPGGSGDRLLGVTVISPSAPMARVLRGKEAGDGADLTRGERDIDVEILGVD